MFAEVPAMGVSALGMRGIGSEGVDGWSGWLKTLPRHSNLLSLANVPGGKPKWASAPITALPTLQEQQEFNAG